MLVKVSSADNNNKFYEVKLAEDGSVAKRWGRVGTGGQSSIEHTGQAGFDKIIRAKKKKGYQEVQVAGAAPSTNTSKERVREVSRASLAKDGNDKTVAKLIDRLVEKNRHEILAASGGMIEVSTDGVLETPLGIIEPSALGQARVLLGKLGTSTSKGGTYRTQLEQYLTLVPQKLPHRAGWEQDFFKHHPIDQQAALLKQLEQSYEWYENERRAKTDAKDDTDYSNLFRYKLEALTRADAKEFERIEKLYMESRNAKHHKDVMGKRLHRVYRIAASEEETKAFGELANKLGNVQNLWHGSGVMNLLNILKQGLFCPAVNDPNIRIAGRMLGPGLYTSASSTKSLRYSSMAWHGLREKDCFMLLNDVICGKEYHPSRASDFRKAHKQYDSIVANPGDAGLLNHECVVWNTEQLLPRFLCEFR